MNLPPRERPAMEPSKSTDSQHRGLHYLSATLCEFVPHRGIKFVIQRALIGELAVHPSAGTLFERQALKQLETSPNHASTLGIAGQSHHFVNNVLGWVVGAQHSLPNRQTPLALAYLVS